MKKGRGKEPAKQLTIIDDLELKMHPYEPVRRPYAMLLSLNFILVCFFMFFTASAKKSLHPHGVASTSQSAAQETKNPFAGAVLSGEEVSADVAPLLASIGAQVKSVFVANRSEEAIDALFVYQNGVAVFRMPADDFFVPGQVSLRLEAEDKLKNLSDLIVKAPAGVALSVRVQVLGEESGRKGWKGTLRDFLTRRAAMIARRLQERGAPPSQVEASAKIGLNLPNLTGGFLGGRQDERPKNREGGVVELRISMMVTDPAAVRGKSDPQENAQAPNAAPQSDNTATEAKGTEGVSQGGITPSPPKEKDV